jgi:hypothetical protein
MKPESEVVFNFTDIDVNIVFPEVDKVVNNFTLKQGGKNYIYKRL